MIRTLRTAVLMSLLGAVTLGAVPRVARCSMMMETTRAMCSMPCCQGKAAPLNCPMMRRMAPRDLMTSHPMPESQPLVRSTFFKFKQDLEVVLARWVTIPVQHWTDRFLPTHSLSRPPPQDCHLLAA